MNMIRLFVALLLLCTTGFAQHKDSVMVSRIIKEATGNSQLQKLGQEMMDGIGPR